VKSAPGTAPLELARRIGLWGATAIVVGNVVGSGIFVAPGDVLRAMGSVQAALTAWILGGALSLVGALAFAELGAAYPHTGGAYVYLRRAFGDRMAFVFGWAELWVIKPTGAAGIAVVFAQYLHEMVPLVPVRALAVGALVLVYGLNFRSVTASSHTQLVLTAIKVIGLAAIAALAATCVAPVPQTPQPLPELAAWGAALVPILWTYDGWSDVNYVAGEIRRPERVVPWSLLLGTGAVTALYAVVVLAVHAGVDAAALQSGSPVLTVLARTAWGEAGARAVTALVLLSTFGSLLAGAITTPRIFWAMGRDGLFFAKLGAVHPRFGTPHWAIVAIAFGATVFVLSGTFDQIITYFVFVMWLFYALTGVALFRLRQIDPATPRPYRARAYPLGPALFVVASLGMLASVVLSSRRESLIGLALVAAGIPAYDLWRRFAGRPQ
jgi:APA family basic amino acid/polyamine antiporter